MQPSHDAIRAQLDRILSSTQFAGSARMSRFLRFIVERSLAGEGERLKEYVVGIEVFDRGNGYDPRVDSIVRVEAGRLRGKLDEYYRTSGSDAVVLISLRKGSYAPQFEQRQVAGAATAVQVRRLRGTLGAILAGISVLLVAVAVLWDLDQEDPAAGAPEIGATQPFPGNVGVDGDAAAAASMAIAVLPFVPYGEDAPAAALGERLTEGIAAELVRAGNLDVVPSARSAAYRDPRAIPDDIGRQLGAQLVLRGRLIVEEQDRLRVEAVLMDGMMTRKPWARSFQGSRNEIDELERRIAGEVDAAAARALGRD